MLLYSGFVDNIDDANKFYGLQRFSSGIGVTQPCQIRYLYYFEAIYNNVVKIPVIKRIKAIVFQTVPHISAEGCRPFYEISSGVEHTLIDSNRED